MIPRSLNMNVCVFFLSLWYVPFLPEEDTRLFPWKPLTARAVLYHRCAEEATLVGSGSLLLLLGTVKYVSLPLPLQA